MSPPTIVIHFDSRWRLTRIVKDGLVFLFWMRWDDTATGFLISGLLYCEQRFLRGGVG